jgi:hypothetical protein
MLLEVRGMESASQTFVQLWGVHVKDFDSEKHCQYCLKGRKEPQLHRTMLSGDYQLSSDAPYFYLFAMGRGFRRDTNVHLAVKPYPGAVASIGSMYGVTFTIRDARALRIDRLPKGWMGLDEDYTTCRNFQFGVQMFGYNPKKRFPTVGEHSLLPEAPKPCSS